MRIVFFGTPELAVPSLEALTHGHEVTALVCQPDRPSGRGKSVTAPPTKVWALEHGIPVHQPARLNDGNFEMWLRGQSPDVCALTAYGRILKQPILDVAPRGILNMHPSLLPLYRGPSPIQSAIINGEVETGVTIMRLTLDMDAGDMVLQTRITIGPDETGESLSAELARLGGRMLREAVDCIATGTATYTQQDHSRATYCRLIEKRDGQIDWNASARTIHNLVRGAQPWPGAHCRLNGQVVKILRTAMIGPQPGMHGVSAIAGRVPGVVIGVNKSELIVATGEGVIAVRTMQLPGKRAMPVADMLRGRAIHPGQRFESIA